MVRAYPQHYSRKKTLYSGKITTSLGESMLVRSSASKLTNTRMGTWTALGVAALVLVGGSPATAAPPIRDTTVTADTSAGQESAGQGKNKKAIVQDFDRQIESAKQFMRTNADGSTYFDMDAAQLANADAATIEIGFVINQLAASRKSPDEGISTRLVWPVWGNWCGPGYGGGAAIDTLDSICRTHDRCYGSRGYFACSCDRAIVSDIRANAHRMGSKERAVAAAVSTYFTYCACNPFK